MYVKGLKRRKTLDLIVVIGLNFASNWLRRWREFSWPIRAKYIKTNANSENLRQIKHYHRTQSPSQILLPSKFIEQKIDVQEYLREST